MIRSVRTYLSAAGCLVALLTGAAAGLVQAQPAAPTATADAILVFDASGSMWGQIDGTNKIVIAREVVGNLLNELPPERRLGLMAYGHNRKSDCNDIEMLAPVGTDRQALRSAVMELNPKGMTPMTAAVQQAAEVLKFSERQATVILVSDGEETCHADPCQAVAALEKLGVDLTVHTVGFGLESAEARNAREQLRCMAETTGGQFFTADNAQELTDALVKVAVAEPVVPAASQVRLEATDLEGGPVIREGLHWTVRDAQGQVVHEADDTGVLSLELKPGLKHVRVERLRDGAVADGKLDPAEADRLTLAIVTELPKIAVTAPTQVVRGARFQASWSESDRDNDYIAIVPIDAEEHIPNRRELTRGTQQATLTAPGELGRYEVRYIHRISGRTLGSAPVEVVESLVELSAPQQVGQGSRFEVQWAGTVKDNDYIAIVPVGAAEHVPNNRLLVGTGETATLTAPQQPGSYEVRYILRGNGQTLASVPVVVAETGVQIDAPTQVVQGARVEVHWTGTVKNNDYIAIVPAGAAEHVPNNRVLAGTKEVGTLTAPGEPGQYEIRYLLRAGKTMASVPLEVIAAEVSLTAPERVLQGGRVEIRWTGVVKDNDYIAFVPEGQRDRVPGTREMTRQRESVALVAPSDPGRYEVQYLLRAGRTLASAPVEVAAADIHLDAPDRVTSGEHFTATWSPTLKDNDYISIVPAQAEEGARGQAVLTGTGDEKQIKAPKEPGQYEIRYLLRDGYRTMARRALTVVAAGN